MGKQWFVVQTLTGQEGKVRSFIESEKRIQGMEESVGEVMMPTEKVTSVKNGKKTTFTKKLYPGYVFIEAELYDGEGVIIERVWMMLKSIQGVIGFLGGDHPSPMRPQEVADIRGTTVVADEVKAKPKVVFEPGETVKIIDGPFMSFSGTVDEVDPERGKLKVSVAIFGRSAPVELEYWQVERDETVIPVHA
ncbi:MAG: transcription termination/antitermination protein NusG [Kiritimatiellaeota bacterium]|nr:transcription termination/antitermination protein NusG [Kiritimatiellota bacterium]